MRILKTFIHKVKGYRMVSYLDDKGNAHLEYEHRLNWKLKYHYVPRGYVIHHKDGDKTNNSMDNLELMTQSEHTRFHDSLGLGLRK
jgi:hypothetical protein